MALKLIAQVLKSAGPEGARRLANDWIVQRREASQWNRESVRAHAGAAAVGEATPAEPTWAETQPWHHG